ncbi:MAG: HEAT repeat domain-containing protein [Candidatus Kariarchaeaceae archaeon]|jgi:hypothetical protein
MTQETSNPSDSIMDLIKRYRIPLFIVILVLSLVLGTSLVSSLTGNGGFISFIIFVFILALTIGIVGIVRFYVSPKRLEHKFNQFHASTFLSGFFRIYFPVVIIALILQFALTLALAPVQFGGLGLLDYERISPSLMMANILSSFITALGVIILSDYEMKKNKLTYSDRVSRISLPKSFIYIAPLTGLYFGAVYFVRFLLELVLGPAGLIPTEPNIVEIDYGVVRGARFWDLLTDTEKDLVLVSFIISYIALEILLRGLMASQARGYQLGSAGIVFMPAVLQATAFTSGISIFSQPIYYLFDLFDSLLLGIVLGIIMWRTGNFVAVVVAGLFIRLLDTRLEFQEVILKLIPDNLGPYNPLDSEITFADSLGIYLVYIQIVLVVLAPFLIIVGYEEVFRIITSLYSSLKDQWFGILIFGFAFILIDLVFYFVLSQLGALLGFIVAILVIGFVIRFLFRVLPVPQGIPGFHRSSDLFEGELPIDVRRDIKFIESVKGWYGYPYRNAILGGFIFLYFLFLSATYRQTIGLTSLEILTFIVFLVILPTLIFAGGIYGMTKAYAHGYFFSASWRSNLFISGFILFFLNVIIWTDRSSTVNFSWRIIPLALIFVLFLRDKPLEDPVMDIASGLARGGRYATFRWIENNPKIFETEFLKIQEIQSESVRLGGAIMAARMNLLDPDSIISNLRDGSEIDRGSRIGMIFSLGILRYIEAEGLLLDQLGNDDLEIKMASYWALSQFATPRALRKMAKVLEENPVKELIPIAEKAILTIDPNYPLAGLRDSIKIT